MIWGLFIPIWSQKTFFLFLRNMSGCQIIRLGRVRPPSLIYALKQSIITRHYYFSLLKFSLFFFCIVRFYHVLLKMLIISKIFQNLVLLSSLILEVQLWNIKITVMWCQHVIIGHQRSSWVILCSCDWRGLSVIDLFSKPPAFAFIVDICLIFSCRSWMELCLWFMECGLHTCWVVLG